MKKPDDTTTIRISPYVPTFLVFLIMRLTDRVDWAWYWVAAPLWTALARQLFLEAIEKRKAGRK